MKAKIILILIVILALFLRFYGLSTSPPGFNADEAALGYNAYSLLQTGQDEWSQSFPLVFKSFSDYKPGIYVYLDLPFVALFGLNELAVRLPSILLGTLSVLVLYLFTKQIFKDDLIALCGSFLLAISPWHLHYSRGAWETNVATFFILLGLYSFTKALKSQIWYIPSVLSFLISIYAYQSTRVVVPLLLLVVILLYWRQIFAFKKPLQRAILANKYLLISLIIFVVLLMPLLRLTMSDRGLARFQGVSIFTDVGISTRLNLDRSEDPANSLVAKVEHNKINAYWSNFIDHYLDHFTPNFLFVSGDPLGRNKIPETGQLYLFEIVTLVLGIYLALKFNSKWVWLVFAWLLIAPVAASLTYQTPHALRAENMVIPLMMLSGLGLAGILKFLNSQRNLRIPGFLLVGVIILFFSLRFWHEYSVHLPKEYALEWEYGFSQMVPAAFNLKNNYQKVVITTRYDQPYILMLFYAKYDPASYQNHFQPSAIDKFGFSTVEAFDKFEFRRITKEEIQNSKNTLFIGTDEEIDDSFKPIKVINFPNGKPVFKFVST